MNVFREMQNEIEEFFHSGRLTKAVLWLCVAFFPLYLTLACNFLSYGSGDKLYALVHEQTGSFVFGLFLVVLVFLAFACLFRRGFTAALVSAVIFTVMPLVDYFKSNILREHFLPWDLLLAKNADSFTQFLTSLVVPDAVWEVVGGTVFYLLFLFLARPVLPGKQRYRIAGTPVLLIFLYFFVGNPSIREATYEAVFGISLDEAMDQDTNYTKHGFLTAFALNFGALNMTEPQHYSKAYVEHMFEKYIPENMDTGDFQNPDVIVVLSESFWDPSVLQNVEFSKDPLQNYHRIAENHPSGSMVSCTFGGGTVRPEFEILTGMTTNMLPPGNVPYQQYVFSDIFSYARFFKGLGYDALGIHTYQKTFYERERAYPLLGFDDFLGEYDMHAEHHWNSGPYITDETIAEEIIYQLEQPHETGLFLMAITMENHGLYFDKYKPFDWDIRVKSDVLSDRETNMLQNYLKGVSDSDRALGVLYDYIMAREKPTVLLWYGDHLPTLGDEFKPYTTTGTISSATAAEWNEEEKYTMFSTPYVIFSNYDTGREYRAEGQAVSPYLLSPLLCDYIAAPECLQTRFLLELFETCPVISPYYKLYSDVPEDIREECIEMHELLTYDELLGRDYLSAIQCGEE